MDISIIVPVYNVDRYLLKSIKSLIDQDFIGEYEIILVDDSSTDNSINVCTHLYERHSNKITLIQNSVNRGVSATRNIGMIKATGQYIIFFDPDDLLPSNALRTLFNAAIFHNADIVKGNNELCKNGICFPASYNVNKEKIYLDETIFTELLKHNQIRGHSWGKIFLKSALNGISFPVGVRMAEDLIFMASVAAKATKMVLINKNVYFYNIRSDGVAQSKYESGSYKEWFNSVNQLGCYAMTKSQKKSYFKLLIKTVHQAARELSSDDFTLTILVIDDLKRQIEMWEISLLGLINNRVYDLKSILRIVQINSALKGLVSAYKN